MNLDFWSNKDDEVEEEEEDDDDDELEEDNNEEEDNIDIELCEAVSDKFCFILNSFKLLSLFLLSVAG